MRNGTVGSSKDYNGLVLPHELVSNSMALAEIDPSLPRVDPSMGTPQRAFGEPHRTVAEAHQTFGQPEQQMGHLTLSIEQTFARWSLTLTKRLVKVSE